MFVLHLIMHGTKKLRLRKSISRFLVVILDPIMLFFGRYASMIAPDAACIYKIAANMWRSDHNWIACIANGSTEVAYSAIRARIESRISQASPSERKRNVFGSHLIASFIQNADWRSVVSRSPSDLIDRCQGAIGALIGRDRVAGAPKSP